MIFFDDIKSGETFSTSSRTIFDADILAFAGLSGDFNRLHVDETYAVKSIHGRRIAHGMLVASIVTGLRSRLDEFAMLGFLETRRQFKKPVFPGDTISADYEVSQVRRSSSQPLMGVVTLDVRVKNQDGVTVQLGQDVLLVECRAEEVA